MRGFFAPLPSRSCSCWSSRSCSCWSSSASRKPNSRDVTALRSQTPPEAPNETRENEIRENEIREISEIRSVALGRVRKLSVSVRGFAMSGIAAAVAHCRALDVPVAIHAALTLVSADGNVRIFLEPAPDARYSAPETIFGFEPCVVWSIACVLVDFITGSPLVPIGRSLHAVLRIVGTLRPICAPIGPVAPIGPIGPVAPIGAVRSIGHHGPFGRLDPIFDAFDASARWRNRAARFRPPTQASLAERRVLSHAIGWSRAAVTVLSRPFRRRFGLVYTPPLDTIPE